MSNWNDTSLFTQHLTRRHLNVTRFTISNKKQDTTFRSLETNTKITCNLIVGIFNLYHTTKTLQVKYKQNLRSQKVQIKQQNEPFNSTYLKLFCWSCHVHVLVFQLPHGLYCSVVSVHHHVQLCLLYRRDTELPCNLPEQSLLSGSAKNIKILS